MLTALIDYESGNLHSALKAFEKMAAELDAGDVVVTSHPDVVARADRLVLPGDGAFPACRDSLINSAIYDALCDAVEHKARPFMGICVGMQLMAKEGHEYKQTPGLGWIDGAVHKIAPTNPKLKIPHMGWNNLVIDYPHPIFDGIESGDHAYFVHSYQMQVATPEQRIAHVDYAGDITAVVARDTMIGLQFHPEKGASQGLHIIGNFLNWCP
jgi:glutamine amidotransferase